jgi:hypothetical protein
LHNHLAVAATRVERAGLLCAQLDGFELHGRVAFGAGQPDRIEELVRYCARPPLAEGRLEKLPDGHYRLAIKTRWRDGTTHPRFEPIELMERLAAQPPRSPNRASTWCCTPACSPPMPNCAPRS